MILALPQSALQEIEFVGSGDRKNIAKLQQNLNLIFDSVSSIDLLKCFFVVENPFWEDNRPPSTYAHTAPSREIYYLKNKDKAIGLMMIYADRPALQFWSNFLVRDIMSDIGCTLGHSTDIRCVNREQSHAEIWTWTPSIKHRYDIKYNVPIFENERLLRTFFYFAEEHGANTATCDQLLAAGMRDWSLRPYRGAVHAWRPGSNSEKIIEYLAAFSLNDEKEEAKRRLHICGEAYSDYQGFIEGALRSAAKVLQSEAFNVSEEQLREKEEFQIPRSLQP